MGSQRLTNTQHHNTWPKYLQQAARQAVLSQISDNQPLIVRMEQAGADDQLAALADDVAITEVVDVYDEQLAELFISRHAQLYKANADIKSTSIKQFLTDHYAGREAWQLGSWVYFPWTGQLVHILEESLFTELRTVRNLFLLDEKEQAQFAAFNVGCAGMSVGSNGAFATVLTGGSRRIKIADGAVLSGSNLNRLPVGVSNVGLKKNIVVARKLYEMNPYIELAAFDNLNDDNLSSFFDQPWSLNLVVDEIDDLPTKVKLRLEARKRKLPVVMVTEPGNQAIIDIERFDQDTSLPLFHGQAPGIEDDLLGRKDPPNQREFIKYFNQIVGVKNLSLRDQVSMTKVGSLIPSPPQLGSTAMITGGIIGYLVRQIALGAPLKSGRHIISLDAQLLANSWASRREHRRHTKAMLQAMRSM